MDNNQKIHSGSHSWDWTPIVDMWIPHSFYCHEQLTVVYIEERSRDTERNQSGIWHRSFVSHFYILYSPNITFISHLLSLFSSIDRSPAYWVFATPVVCSVVVGRKSTRVIDGAPLFYILLSHTLLKSYTHITNLIILI